MGQLCAARTDNDAVFKALGPLFLMQHYYDQGRAITESMRPESFAHLLAQTPLELFLLFIPI